MVRRLRFWNLLIEDEAVVDLGKLVETGEIHSLVQSTLKVFVAITGSVHPITLSELEALLHLPEETWVSAESLDESAWKTLSEIQVLGLIEISPAEEKDPADGDSAGWELPTSPSDGEGSDFGHRYQLVRDAGWHAGALFFHRWNQRTESRLASSAPPFDIGDKRLLLSDNVRNFVGHYGEPPSPYRRGREAAGEVPLTEPSADGQLYRLLRERRTSRRFDREKVLPFEQFSTILKYTFGSWGTCRYTDEFFTLHKTSPSGGGLHPIEAFPIVRKVEGIEAGMYHYDLERDVLVPVMEASEDSISKAVVDFAQKQLFVAEAQFLVVLVARFPRNFWKYRERQNSYLVVMKDAGHLNQTFTLVSAEQGLGSFYTGAISPASISEALGLEPVNESPLGICGCGILDLAEEDPAKLALSDFPEHPSRGSKSEL